MRAAAPLERLRVVLETLVLGREAFQSHAVAEVSVVVDALGAGHELLPAHEEVVGVCEGGVFGGWVGVEGPEGAGELVDGVEVRFVLFQHDFAECLFLCSAEARVSRVRSSSRRKGRRDRSTER